jgi:phospholipase C
VPPAGESVANLLSRGIVDREGKPGPRFDEAAQRQASVHERYDVTPTTTGTFATLPRPGTAGAKGLPRNEPDTRFPADLANGPFRITRYVAYDSPVGDPVHRFFQMWQQVDGGKHDLFTWVGLTSGQGANRPGDPRSGTNQGGVAMGFYSMADGDTPYFRALARDYAIADNYHQPVMGGTGANFLALSTGHAGAYLDAGKPATPPPNQIEDPDPRAGTDNWYKESGYRGGSYTACADPGQPGVKAIRDYLATLPYKPFNEGNCASGTYYLVNNYDPGYAFDGTPQQLGAQRFVLPPQIAPNIGTALCREGVLEMVQRRPYRVGSRQAALLLDLRSTHALDRGDDQRATRQPAGCWRVFSRLGRRKDVARGGVRHSAESRIRAPCLFDRVCFRGLRQGARRQSAGQSRSLAQDGDPGHDRRRGRLLRQRLHPAHRFLR